MSSDDCCPICLDDFQTSEKIYALPCQACNYNFCTNCAATFIRSSKDDYQEASDGSQQVKVHIACPQCRGKYPFDVEEVLQLRRAYTLGERICGDDGAPMDDSELSASELRLKRDFYNASKRQSVSLAHGLYAKFMNVQTNKGNSNAKTREEIDEAIHVWQRLFNGVPEYYSDAELVDASQGKGPSKRNATSGEGKPVVDSTLIFGLDDCMGLDERAFVTKLMTSGDKSGLAQAAMITNGVMHLSSTAQAETMLARLSFQQHNGPAQSAAKARAFLELYEKKERIKKSFPLPNHMPGYVSLPSFGKRQRYLVLFDKIWDGRMIPPKVSAKVFDKIYDFDYRTDPENPNRSVVAVQSVRGPAGKVGLRKDDIITHINDQEWRGSAQELTEHINGIYEKNPDDPMEITITVNANSETAAFLKLRHRLLLKSKIEMI